MLGSILQKARGLCPATPSRARLTLLQVAIVQYSDKGSLKNLRVKSDADAGGSARGDLKFILPAAPSRPGAATRAFQKLAFSRYRCLEARSNISFYLNQLALCTHPASVPTPELARSASSDLLSTPYLPIPQTMLFQHTFLLPLPSQLAFVPCPNLSPCQKVLELI